MHIHRVGLGSETLAYGDTLRAVQMVKASYMQVGLLNELGVEPGIAYGNFTERSLNVLIAKRQALLEELRSKHGPHYCMVSGMICESDARSG